MTNNLVLIHSKEDLKKIPKSLIDDSETKIFSFNVESHKILDKNNITHEIADEILKYSERLEIFDFSVRIHNWFNHEKLNELFNFQNVNILGVLDGNEFQSLIVKSLLNLIIIEKIISKEKPEKIFAGTSFEEYLKIIKKNNIIFDLWLEIFTSPP